MLYYNKKVIFLLIFFSILFLGCADKKISDMNARESAQWVKDAVIYEVYLRSFSKEGTFKALEARVPELKKLGITIISLMPIHPIGELNRRGRLGSPYAVKDFYSVNHEFGTVDDFKSLVNTIHKNDLKIMITLVANQAAWDSQLLMEHPDWFVHNEEDAIVSPHPDLIDVAKLDYNQHELRKYIIAMMKYWIREIGIDGFMCSKSELIPTDFWEIARKELDKIKQVIMISESNLPEYHLKAFDLTYSWTLHEALSNILNETATVDLLNDSLQTEQSQFPKGSLHLLFYTSHNNNEKPPADESFSSDRIKTTAVLSFTLPVVPLIYNGEEAGNNRMPNLFNKVDIDWSKELEFSELYRRLALLRQNHPALRYGSYNNVRNSDSTKVFSFIRSFETDSVLVVINFAKEKKKVSFQMAAGSSIVWKDQFSGNSFQAKDSQLDIALLQMEYLALIPIK